MLKSIKKLSLRGEVVRNLAASQLRAARGGAYNEPTHGCTASCGCGDTGGGNTGGNECLETEFTCQAQYCGVSGTCSCGC